MIKIYVETPNGTIIESKGTKEFTLMEMQSKIEEYVRNMSYFTVHTKEGTVILPKGVLQNSMILLKEVEEE